MYDTFKQTIADLFNNEDFVEYCYIEGIQTKCFCSSIGDNIAFTDAGMVDEANFTLDVELAKLDRIPEINDKVIFRQKQYKISHTQTDSANTTLKIYLIALSKGK